MDKKIYLDNAATSQLNTNAAQSMIAIMRNQYGNPSSLHSYGQNSAKLLQSAREIIAEAFNCDDVNSFIFTSGGTESDNLAIRGTAALQTNKKHIVSTNIEHPAVLNTLKYLEKQGFKVTYINVGKKGNVSPDQVAQAIREDTFLVTIMYANNETGIINPIKEIGKICSEKNILFHTDAVQAVGHVYIHPLKENIDLMSFSAHKFGGPLGTGGLFVKDKSKLKNILYGGGQEFGFRPGTENYPAICGMAIALKSQIEWLNMQKNNKLFRSKNRLISSLKEIIKDEYLYIPEEYTSAEVLPGTLNICFKNTPSESLILILDMYGICVAGRSACSSKSKDPSHVLKAMDVPDEFIEGSVRISTPNLTVQIINSICEAFQKTFKIINLDVLK